MKSEGKRAAVAHQVGHVFRVEQGVQELSCEVNGRLCDWNSSWFRDRERDWLLLVLIIFNQGRLWTHKDILDYTGLANSVTSRLITDRLIEMLFKNVCFYFLWQVLKDNSQ